MTIRRLRDSLLSLLTFRVIYTPYYEKNTKLLVIHTRGENIMTVSSLAAGLAIICAAALIEIQKKELEKETEEVFKDI